MKFYRLSRCVYVLINFSYWDQLQEWNCAQKTQEQLIKGRAMKSNLLYPGKGAQRHLQYRACRTCLPANFITSKCQFKSSAAPSPCALTKAKLPWQNPVSVSLFPATAEWCWTKDASSQGPVHPFSRGADPCEQGWGCWLLCSPSCLCRGRFSSSWAQQSHPEQLQFPQQESHGSLGTAALCSRLSPLPFSWAEELQGIHPALSPTGLGVPGHAREAGLTCTAWPAQPQAGSHRDIPQAVHPCLHLCWWIHCQEQGPAF